MTDNKQRLFEMMNRVSGMPLINENSLPPGFSNNDFMSLEEFAKQSNVNEDDGLHGVKTDPVNLKDIISAREKGQYKGQTAYIHPKTIEKIRVVDENGQEISEEKFRRLTTGEPKRLLGPNVKMGKTGLLKTSLPAYKGLYYDENSHQIKVVNTCPNAGDCKVYCFQQKGGAVQYETAALDKTRALNFLLNHWDRYKAKMLTEINEAKLLNNKKGLTTIIRWHDSGDFLSEKYLNLVMDIAKQTPEVLHYAYTKMVQMAKTTAVPDNFIFRFSVDPSSPETHLIDRLEDKHAEVVPKILWKDSMNITREPVLTKKGLPAYEKGKEKHKKVYRYKSNEDLLELKNEIAQFYNINPNTILSFEEMSRIPEEEVNKWNVIVTPSDADTAAHRKDILGVYLLIH